MSFQPGSVPFLREQLRKQLRADYKRAKQIRNIAQLNFETWPTLSDPEKDVTSRQAQRAIAELSGMTMRVIRMQLDDIRTHDD